MAWQTKGGDSDVTALTTRVETLENTEHEYEVYDIIASGAAGTVDKPAHGTIVLDQYPGAGDCLIVRVDGTTNRPIDDPARDGAGTIITGTLDGAGNYTISGTPATYPVAIVWQVALAEVWKAAELSNDRILNETEIPAAARTVFDDSTTNLVAVNVQAAIEQMQNSNPGIQFDTTNTETPAEGKMYWNADDGTLNVGMPGGNVNLQLGQEMLIRARNTEGGPILNGQAVRIFGAASAVPQVVLVNNLEEESTGTIALATEDVPDNQNGFFTTEGFVRDFDTSALTEGAVVWLGATDGVLTTTAPTNPSQSIMVGYCIRQHATEGVVYVSVNSKEIMRDRQIKKESTGFFGAPGVAYDGTARTVTLTGGVEAYYRGVRVTALTNGWTSSAHAATDGLWYLYYDGTSFVWSQTPWTFDMLQIAVSRYSASDKFGLVETHGFMPWETHRELHQTIGTYLVSGGDLSSFVTGSTTVGDRRPAMSSTVIADEDIQSTLALLNSDLYTQRYLAGAGATITYAVDAVEILPVTGAQPNYNQFTGGTWQQTAFPTNSYGAVFVMAVPVTSDAASQKYRYMFVQPQTVSTTLATIQNLTPASLNMGESSGIVSEYVFVGKIIVRYASSNWTITSVEKLSGNRYSQTSAAAGGFLSAVSTTSSLTGAGTASSPLDIASTVTGNKQLSGYTALGENATGIKLQTYTGTMPAAEGEISIATSIPLNKVIGIYAVCNTASGYVVPPGVSSGDGQAVISGALYTVYMTTGQITVATGSDNTQILNQTVTVTVMYVE